MNHIRQLTSLRGIAAWWVVCFHFRDATGLSADSLGYQFIEHGYLAVDMFFVLSGFVIYINYQDTLRSISWGALSRFFVKRFARVYPLHLVIMLLYLANPLAINMFSSQADLGTRYEWGYYFSSLLLIQNWGFYSNLAWNIPAWSISAEFAAYILFPVILLLIGRLGRSLTDHLVLLILIAALIIVLFWITGYKSLGDGIARIGIFRCILEFGMGVVIGSCYRRDRGSIEKSCVSILSVAVLLIGFSFYYGLPDYVLWPFIFSLIIISLTCQIPYLSNAMGWPVLIYLGEISYSTYLAHYFIKDWVKFLSSEVGHFQFITYLVAVFIASAALYKFIECPGRDFIRTLFTKQNT